MEHPNVLIIETVLMQQLDGTIGQTCAEETTGCWGREREQLAIQKPPSSEPGKGGWFNIPKNIPFDILLQTVYCFSNGVVM